MSEEKVVSNEAEVKADTENVTQDNAQNEYIAESKKYRKRAQDAEAKLAEYEKAKAKGSFLDDVWCKAGTPIEDVKKDLYVSVCIYYERFKSLIA